MRQRSDKPDRSDLRVQDLAKILDTNPRRVEGWVEQGFLKPVRPGRGTGRPNKFNFENLATAYLLTELQRLHGDKSPVLGRLLASEPLADYAQHLAKWFRVTPSPEDDSAGLKATPATLALVQHTDGGIEGRVEKEPNREVLDYLKRFVGKCVGITLLNPGEEFKAVRERLAEY